MADESTVNTGVPRPVGQNLNPDIEAILNSPNGQDIQRARQNWIKIMLGEST